MSGDRLWPLERAYAYVTARPLSLIDPSGGSPVSPSPRAACRQDKPRCDDPIDMSVWCHSPCASGWNDCHSAGGYRMKCKGTKVDCQKILGRLIDVTNWINGTEPNDATPGNTLTIIGCTVCCTEITAGGDERSSYKTQCCDAGGFWAANPCVSYCAMVHEHIGHGQNQCVPLGEDGSENNEKQALSCERNCLIALWNKLGCEKNFPGIGKPPGLSGPPIPCDA